MNLDRDLMTEDRAKGKRLGAGDWVLAALLGATALIVAAQVVWRYLLGDSLLWTEEASRFLFVWMTFLGTAILVGEGGHVRVTTFADSLPPRARRGLEIAAAALAILYLGFLAVVGVSWVALNADTPSPALGLPLNYALYASLPAGALLGLVLAVRRLALHCVPRRPLAGGAPLAGAAPLEGAAPLTGAAPLAGAAPLEGEAPAEPPCLLPHQTARTEARPPDRRLAREAVRKPGLPERRPTQPPPERGKG